RLLGIGRQRLAVADVAERATPGAQVAEDHESRGALAEALADIGAGGFFAHGVQLVLAQDLFDLVEARGVAAGLDAYPRGLLERRFYGHDLDGDAGGLGFAALLDAAFSHRWFSSWVCGWASSLLLTTCKSYATPRSRSCVTGMPW